MAKSHCFLALVLMKAVGMVISTETNSQCHDSDGTIYLQTPHSQKMGDAMGAAIANSVNYTQLPNCKEEGACCFTSHLARFEEVIMGPGPQDNGCGDICCGAHACRGIKATGRSIHCAGSAACAQTTVADGAEESVITVTDGHVECNGGYACQQAKIHFKGTRACMYCPTTRSCRYATLTVAAGTCLQITCLLNHQQACEGVTVTGPGDCYYTSPADEPQDRPQGCTRVMKEEDGCPGSCPKTACCAANAQDQEKCSAACQAPDSCDAGGSVIGDPHIRTIDGKHFTELSQGTYLLWSFDGFNTQVPAAKMPPLVKKMPVDFKIYSHYAGHKAFAKAVLVVEKTATGHQALEMTSHDCLWRRGETTWRPAKDEELLKVADADGDTITAMKVSKGPKAGQEKLLLFMNTETGLQKIAQLWVRCHPRKHLDAKIKMAPAADRTFVKGELGPGRQLTGSRSDPRHGLNLVVTGREFAEVRQWTDLGGSDEAAAYLKEVDSQPGAWNFLSKSCTAEEKDAAAEVCKKHLGEPLAMSAATPMSTLHAEFLADCVFDVCSGGGDEAAAELAAEILQAA